MALKRGFQFRISFLDDIGKMAESCSIVFFSSSSSTGQRCQRLTAIHCNASVKLVTITEQGNGIRRQKKGGHPMGEDCSVASAPLRRLSYQRLKRSEATPCSERRAFCFGAAQCASAQDVPLSVRRPVRPKSSQNLHDDGSNRYATAKAEGAR
ncbi:hypothetical protein GALMADRAFT_905267 [Galerina marginata CBS 339.88]|uniref:Uncharacterized protein n=1 Tax=Galerina marginata (strain CBS 339.88) TaxID=685588 RepID=A0A067SJ90_GALM3|nr:hypothetical protein GALMADRAFT_905267 [Galerina marginata CBS 339.88]